MSKANVVHTRNLITKFGNPSKDNVIKAFDDGHEEMYSYDTLIVIKSPEGELTLTSDWDYSQTTNYYRSQYTGYNMAETRKRIASGQIKTTF